MARSCGLAAPPHAGDVPVQVPGPGRPQHRALAGAQGALKLVHAVPGWHTQNQHSIYSNYTRHGMLDTYVHLRIDIDLSTPLLCDEHNSHVNSI